jgi:hypothetical protein
MNDTADRPAPQSSRTPEPDRGLRQLLTWVFITLVAVVVLAFIVVELTLRSANLR